MKITGKLVYEPESQGLIVFQYGAEIVNSGLKEQDVKLKSFISRIDKQASI